MKELITENEDIMYMMEKMMKRMPSSEDKTNKILNFDSVKNRLCYEIIQKGTYAACILTIDNEIVGLGMTKRDRNDKYIARVAFDVCVHKAIKDYLFGIEPEGIHVRN